MGIEMSAELGGAESSFTAAVEELTKVSVSVLCDVHNTCEYHFPRIRLSQTAEKVFPTAVLGQSNVFAITSPIS